MHRLSCLGCNPASPSISTAQPAARPGCFSHAVRQDLSEAIIATEPVRTAMFSGRCLLTMSCRLAGAHIPGDEPGAVSGGGTCFEANSRQIACPADGSGQVCSERREICSHLLLVSFLVYWEHVRAGHPSIGFPCRVKTHLHPRWIARFYAAPKELELVRRIYKKKGFTNIVIQVPECRGSASSE